MIKIYCADTFCKFNDGNGFCTAKKIALSWHSVMTVNDGRQEFQRCKTREPSAIEAAFKNLLNTMDDYKKQEGL